MAQPRKKITEKMDSKEKKVDEKKKKSWTKQRYYI